MSKNLKPSGYTAVCQCGQTVGAIDLARTDRSDSAKILGGWISKGCDLKAQFGTWSAEVRLCQCDKQ